MDTINEKMTRTAPSLPNISSIPSLRANEVGEGRLVYGVKPSNKTKPSPIRNKKIITPNVAAINGEVGSDDDGSENLLSSDDEESIVNETKKTEIINTAHTHLPWSPPLPDLRKNMEVFEDLDRKTRSDICVLGINAFKSIKNEYGEGDDFVQRVRNVDVIALVGVTQYYRKDLHYYKISFTIKKKLYNIRQFQSNKKYSDEYALIYSIVGNFIRNGLSSLLSLSDFQKYFIRLTHIVASNVISQLLPLGISNHKVNILAQEYGLSKLDVCNLTTDGNVTEEQICAFVGGESDTARMTGCRTMKNGATEGCLLLEILEMMNISPVTAVTEIPRFADMLNLLYYAELDDEDLSETGMQYACLKKYKKYIKLDDHTICHRVVMNASVNSVVLNLVYFFKRGGHQEKGEWNGKGVLPKKGYCNQLHLNRLLLNLS